MPDKTKFFAKLSVERLESRELLSATVLDPIADHSTWRNQPVTVNLSPADAVTDDLSISVSDLNYFLDGALGLQQKDGTYYPDFYGKQEKWLKDSEGRWNIITQDNHLLRWSEEAHHVTGKQIAILDPSVYANPELLHRAKYVQIAHEIIGDQLTVTPPRGYVGILRAEVGEQVFQIQVNNRAPVLDTVTVQTISHSRTSRLTLTGSDADFDEVSLTGRELTLKVGPDGAFYQDHFGFGAKWLQDTDNNWYFLKSDGAFGLYDNISRKPAGEQLGWFSTAAYENPATLIHALVGAQIGTDQEGVISAPAPGQFHNTLNVTPPTNFLGGFLIIAEVSDGVSNSRQVFRVDVTNQTPELDEIADQTVYKNQPLTVSLFGHDADSDPISHAAWTDGQLLHVLNQSLQLRGLRDDYHVDHFGFGAKWFLSDVDHTWYYLRRDGAFGRYDGISRKPLGENLANLPVEVSATPELLLDAKAPDVRAEVVGGELIISPQTDFVGETEITVNVTDGLGSHSRRFQAIVKEPWHDAELIDELFPNAYGRTPTGYELIYWQTRIDKSGPELLGAMEHAYLEELANPVAVAPVEQSVNILNNDRALRSGDKLEINLENGVGHSQVIVQILHDGRLVHDFGYRQTNADGKFRENLATPHDLIKTDAKSDFFVVRITHGGITTDIGQVFLKGVDIRLATNKVRETHEFVVTVENGRGESAIYIDLIGDNDTVMKSWFRETNGSGEARLYIEMPEGAAGGNVVNGRTIRVKHKDVERQFGIEVYPKSTPSDVGESDARKTNERLSNSNATDIDQNSRHQVVASLFSQAYGRAPSLIELSYCLSRTDKSSDALFGAMQYAKLHGGQSGKAESPALTKQQSADAGRLAAYGDKTTQGGDTFLSNLRNEIGNHDENTNTDLWHKISDSFKNEYCRSNCGNVDSDTWTELKVASQDTLVLIFHGSNQTKGSSGGINDLLRNLRNQLQHVKDFETGRNPTCWVKSDCPQHELQSYDDQYKDNLANIKKLIGTDIKNLIVYGYSWGANMAYDITRSLLKTFADRRLLATVYVDAIKPPVANPLTLYDSNSEALLNVYQSLPNGHLPNGTELIWYKNLSYEQFEHFNNPLGRILEYDMDVPNTDVDHGTIEDHPLVINMAEKFMIGAVKQAHNL